MSEIKPTAANLKGCESVTDFAVRPHQAQQELSPKLLAQHKTSLSKFMYEFTAPTAPQDSDEDFSLNDINGGNDSIASQEWSRMSDQFINVSVIDLTSCVRLMGAQSGYREGIVAGKESAIQSGFDHGFADIGAPLGRHLGLLRGLAAGLRSLLDSSKHSHTEVCEGGRLHEEIAKVCDNLSQIQFTDIEPLDSEAIEHAKVHFDPVSTPEQAMSSIASTASHREKIIKQLSTVQASLLSMLAELGMGTLSDLEYAKPNYMAKFARVNDDSAQL